MTIFEATERVSSITEKKFGCKVQFHYSPVLSHMSDQQHADLDTTRLFDILGRNTGAKFVISQGAILVPIHVERDLFGCIEVRNGDILNPEIFEDLHTLIDSTLRDFVIKKELLRRLKIQESALYPQSNIVPIFRKKEDDNKNIFSLTPHDNDPLKLSLFIHGEDYSKMRDLAVDVHSLMTRNSFVPYSVLDFKINFFQEMCELGRISVFIPEILDLAEYEVLDITNYLMQNMSPASPFLIISSQKNLKTLEEEQLVPKSLIEILKRFHLEVNEEPKDQKSTSFWNSTPSTDAH